MTIRMKNFVRQYDTPNSDVALAHFEAKLSFETDCWDVHAALELPDPGFVLVDVRSEDSFAEGHVPGATHIPHAKLTRENLEQYAPETLFVVYCAGPHCNGSTRAARALAALGRPVKEMIGGTVGWLDEGFSLEAS